MIKVFNQNIKNHTAKSIALFKNAFISFGIYESFFVFSRNEKKEVIVFSIFFTFAFIGSFIEFMKKSNSDDRI